jgi:hypothetical protein
VFTLAKPLLAGAEAFVFPAGSRGVAAHIDDLDAAVAQEAGEIFGASELLRL